MGANWKSYFGLNSQNHFKDEWNNFIWGLKHSGLYLVEMDDKLIWSWDTKSGNLSTQLAYEAISYGIFQ